MKKFDIARGSGAVTFFRCSK